jgi:hypothetical protein
MCCPMPRVRNPGSDCLCIVAAVSHHTIWTTPRPSPLALEWKNRIHQRQCLLRVVSVGGGSANRERHAPPVADQMTLAPALGPRPINLVGACEPVQQRKVHQIPNPPPVANRAGAASTSSPTRTRVPAGASARECRCEGRRRCPSGTRDPKRLVGNLVAVVEESARRVGSTRSHNRSGSNAAAIRRSRYFADEDQVREVLLHALTTKACTRYHVSN